MQYSQIYTSDTATLTACLLFVMCECCLDFFKVKSLEYIVDYDFLFENYSCSRLDNDDLVAAHIYLYVLNQYVFTFVYSFESLHAFLAKFFKIFTEIKATT
jgi:hypothetical protein